MHKNVDAVGKALVFIGWIIFIIMLGIFHWTFIL